MTDLLRVARHEAGHIVAAHALGRSIDRASIDPAIIGPKRRGAVWSDPDDLSCKPLHAFSDIDASELAGSIDGKLLSTPTCTLLYARIVEALAGTEAERLFSDTVAVARSDLKQAQFFASYFAKPAALLDLARNDAAQILAANVSKVAAIAGALIEHKTLNGGQIADVLAGRSLHRARWDATMAGAESFRKLHGEFAVRVL